jgi:hypothetical protein
VLKIPGGRHHQDETRQKISHHCPIFPLPIRVIFCPAFTTQITTFSPQKHHICTPDFPKNPCKNRHQAFSSLRGKNTGKTSLRLLQVKVSFHSSDKIGNGGGGGFDGGFEAEVAEGLAGNGADRGQDNARGKGEVGGFEEGEEIAGCRGAGEGDGVRVGRGVGEEALEDGDGFGGDLVAVGFGDGDGGSGGAEGFGEVVAGFGGSDEEEGFAAGVGSKFFGEGFGEVAGRNEVDGEADGLDSFGSGWADDGDAGRWTLWLGEEPWPRARKCRSRSCGGLQAAPAVEGFDGVGTGEEEPVVALAAGGVELSEGGVEGGVGCGRDDLDGGDEDGGRAESFELGGEIGGLVAGSGDEDAFASEGQHRDDCMAESKGSGDGRVVAWISAA